MVRLRNCRRYWSGMSISVCHFPLLPYLGLPVAHNKGFPYYVNMNVTLSMDDELVKKVRKIAVERDTTLTALVREYLEKVAAEDAAFGRKRREREALERSFQELQFKAGKRTWKRADLYARS